LHPDGKNAGTILEEALVFEEREVRVKKSGTRQKTGAGREEDRKFHHQLPIGIVKVENL